MKGTGMIFSGPMVRAILSGVKTQTRRVIDPSKIFVVIGRTVHPDVGYYLPKQSSLKPGRYRAAMNALGAVAVPYGNTFLGLRPGEFAFDFGVCSGETTLETIGRDWRAWRIEPRRGARLWVRETFCASYAAPGTEGFGPSGTAYRADYDARRDRIADLVPEPKWSSPLFLPRALSRIDLDVRGVRLQRLHAITEEDARAEGAELTIEGVPRGAHRLAFAALWDEINGKIKGHAWQDNPWVAAIRFERVLPVDRASDRQEVAHSRAEV